MLIDADILIYIVLADFLIFVYMLKLTMEDKK